MKTGQNVTHAREAGREASPYHYTESGLDHIWLANGFEYEDYDGEVYVRVEDPDALHRSIAHGLTQKAEVLDGPEVRFIRKELGLSQGELATYFDVTAQTVARWEKNETPLSRSADIVLRALILCELDGSVDVCELTKNLARMDRPARTEWLKLTLDAAGWRFEATPEDA